MMSAALYKGRGAGFLDEKLWSLSYMEEQNISVIEKQIQTCNILVYSDQITQIKALAHMLILVSLSTS